MPCLSVIDVDDEFVDETWKRIENCGGFYSIGDGVSKEVFRKMLFGSSLVVEGEGAVVRIQIEESLVEIHPIVFGPSFFMGASLMLQELIERFGGLFSQRPICCIIPDGMRGAKRLARIAGFDETGKASRKLSGVLLLCSVYTWRKET